MKTKNNRMTEALMRLLKDEQPVEVTLAKRDLWCLICTVQVACRHPKFNGPTRQIAESIARQLGTAIAGNDPELRMLMEMGWNPQFDVEQE